ncbi:hypothetical protein BEH94_01325 [Candidatus Altiarchaeales archaeon WOR_SM1_SCG]|nr:hypothetical protein BEH94_01325 [Candidatus Altiarchaeales archaeon WOR_SM1_SCG]
MELHPHEIKILKVLNEESSPEIISEKSGLDLDAVMRASSWLSTKNLIKIERKFTDEISLDVEGNDYAESGLPERKIINLISDSAAIDEIAAGKKEKNIALGWLRRKGLAKIEKINGKLTITVLNKNETCDEKLLKLLKEKEKLIYDELSPELREGFELLKQRQNVIKIKEKKEICLIPTEEGIKSGEKLKTGKIKTSISQLTPEMLKNRGWKDKTFRHYDAEIYIKPKYPAKKHPLRRVIDEIRAIFLEMGFKEITGNFVESAFWNFDALFQPQDHPARDMHDTFYLKNPESIEISKFDELKDKVGETHENGWKTGSTGWKYKWSPDVARQTLLRTHTTAVTARYLSKLNKNSLPAKVFCIGKTFRNEAIDYKHLPEFYQVEGIVADENANFKNLLSILKIFYKEMGFEKVRFRPAYFPYTEMSVEPEIYFEEKGEWMELGGAGIFRPEVVMPLLGFDCPVLAWGLGLDRVVALKLGLNDIRDLYISDLKWLRESKI